MPVPINIQLHKKSRILEIEFEDNVRAQLPCEYLRVYSPSAAVRGHGEGEGVLQIGKEEVGIQDIQPIGHYAIQLIFDDGHDTGFYTWDYLYSLSTEYEQKWQAYLDRLVAAGHTRKI
ncbi:MAG: DUF971 domain-containing protein [Gammaproteobacteria bacterium]|nr:DUF971 domain-containing protein [Gammaproteobacteria bacterium]